MDRWYESEACQTGNLIGGQICLVRNVAGYPFAEKMDDSQRYELTKRVCDALKALEDKTGMSFSLLDMSEDEQEEKRKVGRLSIPPQMLSKHQKSQVLLSADESVSILLNGKEEICIQISCGGRHIQEAMYLAEIVDDCLNRYLEYAFNEKYGYLSANPLYTGTGMSASYLLYLPYLEKKRQLEKMQKELGQYGFTLTPQFRGRKKALGSVYRLKNRKTLGLSEREILSTLEHVTQLLVEREQGLAKQLLAGNALMETDEIYRAYGLLRYALKLDYEEAMTYLSIVHRGDVLGLWEKKKTDLTEENADEKQETKEEHKGSVSLVSFAMMVAVSDVLMTEMSDKKMMPTGSQIARMRADYIRQYLQMTETSMFNP